MIGRRGFLGVLAGALAAPAIIRTPGLLMPVKVSLAAPEPVTINGIPIYPSAYCPEGTGILTQRSIANSLAAIIRLAGGEVPVFAVMNPRDYAARLKTFA